MGGLPRWPGAAAHEIQGEAERHLLSPGKRRIRKGFTVVCSCLMEGYGGDRIRFLSKVHSGRSRGNKHKVDMGNIIQIYVRAFSLCRWSMRGPGRLWPLQPWRYPKLGWTQPWATCSTCICFEWGLGQETSSSPFWPKFFCGGTSFSKKEPCSLTFLLSSLTVLNLLELHAFTTSQHFHHCLSV